MLLTDEVDYGWQCLFECGVLDVKDTEIVCCSNFRQDENLFEKKIYQAVNRIKNCMEVGKTVILVHSEDLYDCLFVNAFFFTSRPKSQNVPFPGMMC